jgi:hypothetical protein
MIRYSVRREERLRSCRVGMGPYLSLNPDSTLGGWCLWLVWLRAGVEYARWRWAGYGCLTAMELAALILLFHGRGPLWYRSAGRS